MVGIVVIGHATAPTGLVQAAEMVLGEQPNIRALNLQHDTNLEQYDSTLQSHVADVDTGDGVLILCDLFGGSPANTAVASMAQGAHIVTGVNFPMLLEVLGNRETMSADELVQMAVHAGTSGIVHVNALLNEEGSQ